MSVGNPYHDERGRFTTPYGAYNAAKDRNVSAAAHCIADNWQMSSSEIDPNECLDDWGEQTDSAYEEAMDREFREKCAEFEEEVSEVYTEYNTEMRTRISKMNYAELQSWSADMDATDAELRTRLKEEHPDVEAAADYAAEDFDTDVADYRYRRIVAKTNGKYQLYDMALDEKDGYGLNGYAYNYATQKIHSSGLEKDFENYRLAKEAYVRGDQALGKDASKYKDEKSYIRAKMKYYRQVQTQYDLIQKSNPMNDDYHTGIRSVSDIKSFNEVMGTEDIAPDFTAADIRKARAEGKVTVYSSKPIVNGTFVTPSKMEAKNYAGKGKVYSQKVRLDEVAWIDGIEGQFASDDVPF